MRSGGWYYKDRLGRTRGPLELITLKTAWGGGIIDKDTFIWGEDMDEWAPIHMVYGLERAIATWEGQSSFRVYLFICFGRYEVEGYHYTGYQEIYSEVVTSITVCLI